MAQDKLRLSQLLNVGQLRAEHHKHQGKSLFEYIKTALIKDEKDFFEMFTTADITQIEGYEKHLYVEPREYLFGQDFAWEWIKKENGEVEYKDYTNSEALIALTKEGKPKGIFLVGDIGCGKTTFVRHFQKLFEKTVDNNICMLMDFSDWANKIHTEDHFRILKLERLQTMLAEIDKKIVSCKLYDEYLKFILLNANHPEFTDYLAKWYTGEDINWKDFQSFRNAWCQKNPERSISLGCRFLGNKGYKILLILDNIDPIPLAYQERFARDALDLVHTGNIQVMITLRFCSLKLSAHVAKAYKLVIVLKLDLPSIRELIDKRMKYFIYDKMTREKYDIKWDFATLKDVTKERIIQIINYINDNLLSDELINTFICISDLNIRFILVNYLSILDSKHISLSADVIHGFFEDKIKFRDISPVKSYDLLLMSVIAKQGVLYSNNDSPVENVYDVYSPARGSYFPNLLKTYLLRLMYNLTVRKSWSGESKTFVTRETLIQQTETLGWGKPAINEALRELEMKSLIFGYDSDSFEYISEFTLSNNGCFYESRVCRMVYYMFFMLFDFPIKRARIDKYFKSVEVDSFGEEYYSLRDEFESL